VQPLHDTKELGMATDWQALAAGMRRTPVTTTHKELMERAVCALYEREREEHSIRDSIQIVADRLKMCEVQVKDILGFRLLQDIGTNGIGE
jgi:hypothetical protein